MKDTDLPTALSLTEFDAIHNSPTVQAAKQLHEAINLTHALCVAECPRWSSLFDQCSRSSSSVYLNLHEAAGRLRGHWLNAMLIARGEAYETAASLAIGPKQWQDLKPLAKTVISGINEALKNAV